MHRKGSSRIGNGIKKTAVKKPKKPANPKGKYIIHSDHQRLPVERDITQYLAFDPGRKNLAMRVERRHKSYLDDYCALILTIAQGKHQIVYQRVRVGTGSKSKATLQIHSLLHTYVAHYDRLNIVLIEGQMDKNREMMHLQYTVISYFLLLYPHIVVVEIGSKLKSINLGAPPKLTQHFLKKWGCAKAMSLATRRNDRKFIHYIEKQTKGKLKKDIKIDDDCDTLIEIEAFCVEAEYQLTEPGSSESSIEITTESSDSENENE